MPQAPGTVLEKMQGTAQEAVQQAVRRAVRARAAPLRGLWITPVGTVIPMRTAPI